MIPRQQISLLQGDEEAATRLANALLESQDKKASVEYYRKAVVARLTFAEKSPNSIANRGLLPERYTNLAKALASSDREDAFKQYGNAIELLLAPYFQRSK